jgi:hypothetical protein
MKLALRSLAVLAVGCVVAAGCYFALGSLPTSALGGVRGGHEGHRGQPPAGFAAAGSQAPADAPQFRGDGDGDGGRHVGRDREGFGGREGHGGAGVLGVFKNVTQIAIVTVLVVLLGWAVRSRGRDRMTPATDSA